MTRTTIMQTPNYELVSYGNGTSYLLKHGTRAIALQGDDATQFRDDLNAAEKSNPEMPSDDILREFWHMLSSD